MERVLAVLEVARELLRAEPVHLARRQQRHVRVAQAHDARRERDQRAHVSWRPRQRRVPQYPGKKGHVPQPKSAAMAMCSGVFGAMVV